MRQSEKPAGTVLCDNIRGLLKLQHKTAESLAFALNKHKTWISKILNTNRGMPNKYLNAVADFFGLEPYQLFQPGIVESYERRAGEDRRSGTERRVSAEQQTVIKLAQRLHHAPRTHHPSAIDPALTDAYVEAVLARIQALESRRQTPEAGQPLAKMRARGRTRRRPNVDSSE